MTARELIEHWATQFAEQAGPFEDDRPIAPVSGRLVHTIGTLYLYEFHLPSDDGALAVDIPVSVVLDAETEPAEGVVLSCRNGVALVQTFDAIGTTVADATIIPDRSGYLMRAAERFRHMMSQPDSYRLGPADRLAHLLRTSNFPEQASGSSAAVLTTMWTDTVTARQQKVAATAIEFIRANKRILLISPDHHAADEISGAIARAMKAGVG